MTTTEMTEEDVDRLVVGFRQKLSEVMNFMDTEGEIYLRPSDITAICVNHIVNSRRAGIKGGDHDEE